MTGERYRFGHLRSRETRKPSVFAPPVTFYRCRSCGNLMATMQGAQGNQTGALQGAQEAQPEALQGARGAVRCCEAPMEALAPHAPEEFADEITLSYQIIGSLNENAVKAMWECRDLDERPEWIWLRTFSGAQLKYVKPGKRSPLMFGLADEDAYAYCDKDPCVECTFRCKRGFGLYYYFEKRGVIWLPLERMSARQQSRKD